MRLPIATSSSQASYEKIYNYLPGSQVTDHNALDLDQKALEADLAESPVDYTNAKAVYQNGGHSKSYATIAIGTTVTGSHAAGAACGGKTSNGAAVTGKLKSAVAAGDATFDCYYPVSDVQSSYNSCKGGGLEAGDLTAGRQRPEQQRGERHVRLQALQRDRGALVGEADGVVDAQAFELEPREPPERSRLQLGLAARGCLELLLDDRTQHPHREHGRREQHEGRQRAADHQEASQALAPSGRCHGGCGRRRFCGRAGVHA